MNQSFTELFSPSATLVPARGMTASILSAITSHNNGIVIVNTPGLAIRVFFGVLISAPISGINHNRSFIEDLLDVPLVKAVLSLPT